MTFLGLIDQYLNYCYSNLDNDGVPFAYIACIKLTQANL